MRPLLSFTVEHFLLFEASLLQYACFVAAVTGSSNLSTSSSASASACSGCNVAAAQTLLSFPADVHEVTSSLSVTVIPYVTVYDDGKNITNYSTYTKYSSGASSQGLATNAAPLTWETFGTTLTYPTTYYAYYDVSASANRNAGGGCTSTIASVELAPTDQAHLVFPYTSGESNAELTSSAQSVLDSLPTISALVSPNAPAQCSHQLGFEQPLATASPLVPFATSTAVTGVTHTSVEFLTSQGQAVITRATGYAPPQSQVTGSSGSGGSGGGDGGGGEPSRPTSSSGQGGLTNLPSNGGQGGNSNQHSTPVLNFGGSTITAGPSGVFNIGGHPVTAGGAAQVIGGTTVSIAAGGSVAVINGHTSSLSSVRPSSSGPAQATGGADGQVPVPITTWFAGVSIGLLGMVISIYL